MALHTFTFKIEDLDILQAWALEKGPRLDITVNGEYATALYEAPIDLNGYMGGAIFRGRPSAMYPPKKYALKELSEINALKLTSISVGRSLAIGCSFYRTFYDTILITDYDVLKDVDSETKHTYTLIKWTPKGPGATMTITYEVLANSQAFAATLANFNQYCINRQNGNF